MIRIYACLHDSSGNGPSFSPACDEVDALSNFLDFCDSQAYTEHLCDLPVAHGPQPGALEMRGFPP